MSHAGYWFEHSVPRLERLSEGLSKTLLMCASLSVQVPVIEVKLCLGEHLADLADAICAVSDRIARIRTGTATPIISPLRHDYERFPQNIVTCRQCLDFISAELSAVCNFIESSGQSAVSQVRYCLDSPSFRVIENAQRMLVDLTSALKALCADERLRDALDRELPHKEWVWHETPSVLSEDFRLSKRRQLQDDEDGPNDPEYEIAKRYHRILISTEVPTIEACAHNIACSSGMPFAFIADMARQAADESRHAQACIRILRDRHFDIGSFSDRSAMWALTHDKELPLRLAIHQRIGETLGVNSASWRIHYYDEAGQHELADVERIIYVEEISHVEIGNRWLRVLCSQNDAAVEAVVQDALETWFRIAPEAITGARKYPVDKQAMKRAGYTNSEIESIVQASPGTVRLKEWTVTRDGD